MDWLLLVLGGEHAILRDLPLAFIRCLPIISLQYYIVLVYLPKTVFAGAYSDDQEINGYVVPLGNLFIFLHDT